MQKEAYKRAKNAFCYAKFAKLKCKWYLCDFQVEKQAEKMAKTALPAGEKKGLESRKSGVFYVQLNQKFPSTVLRKASKPLLPLN